MPPVRALVLDLDDTLVDSRAAYRHALAALGIDHGPGSAYARARAEVKARLPGDSPSAHSRLLYFQALLGPGCGPGAVLALLARYEAALADQMAQQWRRLGRARLLRRLSAHLPCIILTNETARTQLGKWCAVDPDGACADALIASESVGHDKPHPAMFEAACARLRLAPEHCLMVGDDVVADVGGARAFGMQAVLTREFAPPGTGVGAALPAGCAAIDRLDDLLQLAPVAAALAAPPRRSAPARDPSLGVAGVPMVAAIGQPTHQGAP